MATKKERKSKFNILAVACAPAMLKALTRHSKKDGLERAEAVRILLDAYVSGKITLARKYTYTATITQR